MTIPIFYWNGKYFGFIHNGWLYSKTGRHIGWLEGQNVFRSNGRYLGDLVEGNYILRQIQVGSIARPVKVYPPIPALPAIPPAREPKRIRMGWVDALEELSGIEA